ncbi:hypothetical protein ACIQLK_11030 [Microbacterium sp. NPDC091382]|uniref:hypothetical protein n=1 Tax=Microbacterium sp. NPDC091382 TaxID=3364210 RepID=UPI0037FD54CE
MDIAALGDEVEAVSAFYAERHDITRTDDWLMLMLKLGEEVGELTKAYLARCGWARDRGRTEDQLRDDFRAELSDVLARVLLIMHRFNIDRRASRSHEARVKAGARGLPGRDHVELRLMEGAVATHRGRDIEAASQAR